MSLYEQLKRAKEKGEEFNIYDISEDTIRELIRIDHISYRRIGILCGVDKTTAKEVLNSRGISIKKIDDEQRAEAILAGFLTGQPPKL